MKQNRLTSPSQSCTGKEKVFRIVFFILIVIWISFIFSNSFLSGSYSKSISVKVTEQVNKTTTSVGLKPTTDNTVRKIAHFIEFYALGFFTFGFSASIRKRKLINAFFCSVFSLLVALTDETIQIYSKRGSSVKDVWLDAISASIAVFTFYFVMLLISRKKARSSASTESGADTED